MREILFRAKEIKTGEWVYGGYYEADFKRDGEDKPYYTDHRIYTRELSREHNPSFKVDPETVGQYTGLKDRNGKCIFEGDIIKNDYGYEYQIGVVSFGNGYFDSGVCPFRGWFIDKFYTVREGENPFCFEEGDDNSLLVSLDYFEVVGNIHDNPELLELLDKSAETIEE